MKKYIIPFFAVVFLAGMSSCIKDKFSAPPATNTDPNLVPNTTIAALSAMATTAGVQVTQSLILEAVVVGDDRSGNLYKELDIEDSTGGIMLMITGADLYANYPVGRRLFIQLQGLYIVNYDGTNEIVASVDNGNFTGISTSNLSQYVVPGKWGINTAPKVVALSDLTGANGSSYQSQLVQLNNVEFSFGSRGTQYANGVYQISGSLTLQDCNLNTATVYTSGYANFANSLSPSGNGTMVCLAGYYNGAAQIIIRDTTDLHLTGTLCP